jgi:hypothetical protein
MTHSTSLTCFKRKSALSSIKLGRQFPRIEVTMASMVSDREPGQEIWKTFVGGFGK